MIFPLLSRAQTKIQTRLRCQTWKVIQWNICKRPVAQTFANLDICVFSRGASWHFESICSVLLLKVKPIASYSAQVLTLIHLLNGLAIPCQIWWGCEVMREVYNHFFCFGCFQILVMAFPPGSKSTSGTWKPLKCRITVSSEYFREHIRVCTPAVICMQSKQLWW